MLLLLILLAVLPHLLLIRWPTKSGVHRLVIVLTFVVTVYSLLIDQVAATFVGFIMLLSASRGFMNRYGQRRLQRNYKRSFKSGGIVASSVLIVAGIWLVEPLFVQTAVPLGILLFSIRSMVLTLIRTHSPQPLNLRNNNLPTVTLAIPARNETHALTDTLRAAISSSYERLEILVLDDCSQDATPEIIRSFAHDGVRFVQGREPKSSWLGKNAAYDELYRQASGDIILFCGVDVQLQSDSIERLVALFLDQKLSMLSVMPNHRKEPFLAKLTRPVRYYWQLAAASHPLMNSCWMVERELLQSGDFFTSYRGSIIPEQYIAHAARQVGRYRFMVSNNYYGVDHRKRVSSLYETAVRTLYPRLNKDPVLTIVNSVWSIVLGLVPFTFLAGNNAQFSVQLLQLSAIIQVASYVVSEYAQQTKTFWVALFMPVHWFSEAVLSVLSFVKYEFGEVNWKGRNVCIPVLKSTATQNRSRDAVDD